MTSTPSTKRGFNGTAWQIAVPGTHASSHEAGGGDVVDADTVDGHHQDQDLLTSSAPSFSKLTALSADAADFEALIIKKTAAWAAFHNYISWRDASNICGGFGMDFSSPVARFIWHSMYSSGYKGVGDVAMRLDPISGLYVPVKVTTGKLAVTDEGAHFSNSEVEALPSHRYVGVLGSVGNINGTGTLQIALPKTWCNACLTIRIRGFEITTNKAVFDLTVGGYAYSATPAWLWPGGFLGGTAVFSSARLAYNTALSKLVILLGTMSTAWAGAYLAVVDVQAAYQGHDSGWETGYDFSVLANENDISYAVDAR